MIPDLCPVAQHILDQAIPVMLSAAAQITTSTHTAHTHPITKRTNFYYLCYFVFSVPSEMQPL